MRYLALALACILLLVAPARGGQQPFDVIVAAYAPYMSAGDPLAMPMKIAALRRDPYTFWRGSKDLFFDWCKRNARDWLDDRSSYVPCHGDLHFGNIGAYVPAANWGGLAIGPVDFDDTAVMPYQIELLQGMITLELTATASAIALEPADREALADALLEGYQSALRSTQTASILLDSDPAIAALLNGPRSEYEQHLSKLTTSGRFRPVVMTGRGQVREIFRSAGSRQDDLAAGIAEALGNSSQLKDRFRFHTADAIRGAMMDAALRTRINSSGSQGLKKYFVLLRRPLRDADHDVIVYLKQQIPPAAERAGAVSKVDGSPARQMVEHMVMLTSPPPFASSWCTVNGESYWLTLSEPWSDELDAGDFTDLSALLRGARLWGVLAGAAHREAAGNEKHAVSLTPGLRGQLLERSAAYVAWSGAAYAAFVSDPRSAAAEVVAMKYIELHLCVHPVGGR